MHRSEMKYDLAILICNVGVVSQVQDFLVHFWQGMPTHMLPILGCQATVDLVVVCDFLLYRVSHMHSVLCEFSLYL